MSDISGLHICSFTDFDDVRLVTADGSEFRFEFSKRFGPLMIGKRGRTIDALPPKRSKFWRALTAWCKQGHRVDGSGYAVFSLPAPERYVTLAGRHMALVPEGVDPATVRREWFAKMDLPEPQEAIEVIVVEPQP